MQSVLKLAPQGRTALSSCVATQGPPRLSNLMQALVVRVQAAGLVRKLRSAQSPLAHTDLGRNHSVFQRRCAPERGLHLTEPMFQAVFHAAAQTVGGAIAAGQPAPCTLMDNCFTIHLKEERKIQGAGRIRKHVLALLQVRPDLPWLTMAQGPLNREKNIPCL